MSNRISDAIFWVAVVSCVIAQLFILRAVFHKPLGQPVRQPPRRPPGAPPGAPSVPEAGDESPEDPRLATATLVPQPRRASEFVWSVLPAVLLVLLFVGAWRTMHRERVTDTPAAVFPDAAGATQP